MAAVEETFKNKVSLICSLCQEKFQQPVILPCMHTYCEKCLGDFVTSLAKSNADEKLKDFRCPTCRIPVRPKDPELEVNKWATTLPRNIVMEIMITLSEGKKQSCQTCASFDEKSVATAWCTVCEEAMCEKCTGMHNRMKLLKHHHVVQIENLSNELHGMFSNAVTSICGCQHGEQIKHFCPDHNDILCSCCRCTLHSQCKDVNDISTLVEKHSECTEHLINLRESISRLKSEKEKEKEELKLSVEGLIKEAKNSIEEIKIKLDSLFESFKKKVLVFHEEEITKSNVRLRLLEQLAKNIDHWRLATTMVKDQEMKREGFIFLHGVKQQIGESIREISNLLELGVISRLDYKPSKPIPELDKCDSIGSFEVEKKYPESEIDTVYECCKVLKIPISTSFKGIKVEFVRTITVDGAKTLTCGECFDRKLLVVGDWNPTGNLHMVHIRTGSVAKIISIGNYVKRLCIDRRNSQIFVTCSNLETFRVRIQDNEFQKAEKLMFIKESVGGMVVRKGDVHVIGNGKINKFVSSADPNATGKEITQCFNTNTGSSSCGGISTYKKNILYTTKDTEIKCTNSDGKVVFCFQNAAVKSPGALSVLRSGDIFVLDRDGKLHFLSANGRQFRTALEKFETVTTPCGMWTDSIERSLYVCGGKNIDIYRIL